MLASMVPGSGIAVVSSTESFEEPHGPSTHTGILVIWLVNRVMEESHAWPISRRFFCFFTLPLSRSVQKTRSATPQHPRKSPWGDPSARPGPRPLSVWWLETAPPGRRRSIAWALRWKPRHGQPPPPPETDRGETGSAGSAARPSPGVQRRSTAAGRPQRVDTRKSCVCVLLIQSG